MINFFKKIIQLKITKIIFWSIFWVWNLYFVNIFSNLLFINVNYLHRLYFSKYYLEFNRSIIPFPGIAMYAIYKLLHFLIFLLDIIVIIYFLFFKKSSKNIWHYIIGLVLLLTILSFIHCYFESIRYDMF